MMARMEDRPFESMIKLSVLFFVLSQPMLLDVLVLGPYLNILIATNVPRSRITLEHTEHHRKSHMCWSQKIDIYHARYSIPRSDRHSPCSNEQLFIKNLDCVIASSYWHLSFQIISIQRIDISFDNSVWARFGDGTGISFRHLEVLWLLRLHESNLNDLVVILKSINASTLLSALRSSSSSSSSTCSSIFYFARLGWRLFIFCIFWNC